MIDAEPKIKAGICEGCDGMQIRLNGLFTLDGRTLSGLVGLVVEKGTIRVVAENGKTILRKEEIMLRPSPGAAFTLCDVTIGRKFHWERKQDQTFTGDLRIIADASDKLTVIDEIDLEDYLVSVISSEMSAEAPMEFLKAHAVISRSWLAAMMGRRRENTLPSKQTVWQDGEHIRWYDREDHDRFDVCADDHCQRYQGIPQHHGGRAEKAVRATRGLFLVSGEDICDARYHKACGGLTDNFATAWEDAEVPYLVSVSDGDGDYPPVRSEQEATRWILAAPEAYCHARDSVMLKTILPDFDRETADFFRWQVAYRREELEEIITENTEADFGVLSDLVPLDRGPSGRICRLQIVGTKHSLIVGKELEIRRLLSRSHLLSSAFVVSVERASSGLPINFILRGAGWGHGVGLCQIGAAVMAARGFRTEEILSHYFRGAVLRKLY